MKFTTLLLAGAFVLVGCGGYVAAAPGDEPAQTTAPGPQPQAAAEKAAGSGEAKPAPAAKDHRPFDSLMFSTDEFNEIRSRMTSGGETDTSTGRQAIEDATLYLSTIVYYGPKQWTIWVNNVPISPDQEFKSFQVTEITPNYVELLVPLSAQGMRPVRLAPNQTFVTKTGAVIEGKVN